MQLLTTVPVAKTPQKPADKSEEISVKRVDTDVGSSNKSKTTSVRSLTESDSWRDSGDVEPKKGSPRASSTDADDGWMGPEDDYDIVDEINDTDDLDGGGVSMGNDESVDERGRTLTIGGRNSASASGAGFDMDEDDEKPLGWKQSSRARGAELTMRRSRRGDGADSPNGPMSESWRSLNFATRKEDVEKKRKKDIIASDEVGRTSSRLNAGLIGESWRHSCLAQQQNATSSVSYESWRGTTSTVESHLNLIRTKDDEKRTAHNIRPLLEPFLSRRSLLDADNDSSNNNSTDSGSSGKGYDKNMGKGQRVSSNAERWKKTKQRMEKSPNKKKNVMEPVDEQFDAPSIWD
ncbi:unnamed protein product, partial [Anisakis simplex]|uniref:GPALPP motifs-containing protein 1 n=1 Tax=Anisakis simplex TaxID=6269 RepID=A0A0M3KHK9_ANISI